MKKKEGKKAVDKNERKDVMIKEIDLIQGCINRMAQNSFVIKGWLITLFTIVLTLLPDKKNINVLCVVLMFVTIVFWRLDAFFLKTERLYRWKYEWVIKVRNDDNNDDKDKYKYDLDPNNSSMWLPDEKNGENKTKTYVPKKEPKIREVMFSKTLLPFYGIVFLTLVALAFNIFGLASFIGSNIQQSNDAQINFFSIFKQ